MPEWANVDLRVVDTFEPKAMDIRHGLPSMACQRTANARPNDDERPSPLIVTHHGRYTPELLDSLELAIERHKLRQQPTMITS